MAVTVPLVYVHWLWVGHSGRNRSLGVRSLVMGRSATAVRPNSKPNPNPTPTIRGLAAVMVAVLVIDARCQGQGGVLGQGYSTGYG